MHHIREIPVVGKYDLVICGGGAAGIGAAIAAAERGVNTALVERFSFLGGMATAGFVNPMSEFAYNGRFITGGIPRRFAEKLIALGGAQFEEPRCNLSFDPEVYKLAAYRMLTQAGVTLYMNTFLSDCIRENGTLSGVIISNKEGLQVLEADFFIDATGDADLAWQAGLEMLPQRRDRQPGSLCFCLSGVDTSTQRMHIIHQRNHRFNHQAIFVRETLLSLREQGIPVPQFGGPWLATTMSEGCITVNMTRSPVDATNVQDLQCAEAKMREDIFTLVKLMKEHVAEFRNCRITAIAPAVGVRESRRVKGMHILTGQEYIDCVKFHDSVARACHPVDIHLPGDEGQELTFPTDAGYIPFRSLITSNEPNLLIAGRCISADAEAFAAIRVQAPCMETGQATGIAVALCKADGVAVQDVNITKLVAEVRREGSVLE